MRRTLSILLSLVMLLGVMPAIPVKADPAVKETRYQLVTACINVWKSSSGAWQAGVKPGDVYNGAISGLELTGDFDRSKVSNVRFYNGKTFDPTFDFATKNFAWNSNPQYAPDKDGFVQTYYMYSLRGLNAGTPKYNPKDGKVSFSYSGNLETIYGQKIDLKTMLAISPEAGANQVAQMMGYGSLEAAPADLQKKLVDMYPKGGQSSNVEGYLFFAPFLIEYDVLADEPVLPLLPPKCVLDCNTSSAFIGKSTPVKGYVTNQNTYPVIMRYEITANGKTFYSGSKVMNAKEKLPLSTGYTIPSGTKPGTRFEFQIKAANVAPTEGPPEKNLYHYVRMGENHDTDIWIKGDTEWAKYLGQFERGSRSDVEERTEKSTNPDWTAYMAIHSQDSGSGAWYLNAAQWAKGESNVCKRSAVPQPIAPVDHNLAPSVIIDEE